VLFFLSPLIGELLSGSAPPSEFFTLFGFTIMSLLYGGGAVIARELKITWGKGVGSLLLIGASYGIVEEGLMVASFQNPNWIDLGFLGSFGRWVGVNWVWAVELMIYHSIVSITVPTLLVELFYPLEKNKSWLKGRWRKILPALFIANVVIGFFLFSEFTGFTPAIPQYVLFVVLSLMLLYFAYIIPNDLLRRGNRPLRKPRYYFLISFLGSIVCGFVFGVLPERLSFTGAPVIVIILGVGIIVTIFRFLASYNWSQSSPLHYHRLIFGSLFIFIIFSFFQEFDTSRLDDTTGMSIVGSIFLIAFLILGYKLAHEVD